MEKITTRTHDILKDIHVNVPFPMLAETYLDLFISRGINPEIGLDVATLDGYPPAAFETVALGLKRAGLSVTFHGPFIDLSPGSPDPEIRAVTRRRFEQVVRLMPLFQPKSVVCHAGYVPNIYRFVREAWLENSLETWNRLAPAVGAEGGRLMLENVFEHHPADIRILFEELAPHPVGLCLDTGHQSAFSRASLAEWLSVLGPFVGQLHLHDNHGERDEHIALGHGRIDFNALFAYLKQHRVAPPIVTLEPHEKRDLDPSLDYLETRWPWGPGGRSGRERREDDHANHSTGDDRFIG